VARIDIADSQHAQIITGEKISQIVHPLAAEADGTHRQPLTRGH
jgi:hypothetical protein